MVFRNRTIDKGKLKKLISWAFTHYGTARTSRVADRLKNLGFQYATKAGVSISVDDLVIPASKRKLLEAAEQEIHKTEDRYMRGEITEVERFQKAIDTWNDTSEALKDEVVRNFRSADPLNSVYMMAFSGARGNISQVRQLVGMRGLMADPQGQIIYLPIKTNFREGLTVTEYIISSYGARKGLVDTALRTADSGYLTRRLVDVSQDVIVRDLDCGTTRGVWVRDMTDGDRVLIPLKDKLVGRVAAEDAVHPETGEVVLARNQQISTELISAISRAGIKEIFVRSPLTCEAPRSVCQLCYGWSLAHSKLVDLGEAVGIIAAQSIGEPGTQLTMRTFHTGGVFTAEAARVVRAIKEGTVRFPKQLRARPFRTRHGQDAFLVESSAAEVTLVRGETEETFAIPQGAILFVKDGEKVEAEQVLAEVPATGRARGKSTEKATKDVATDLAGEIKFAEIVPEEKKDRQGNTTRIATRGGLIWVMSGQVFNLLPGAEPVAKSGSRVNIGDVLAETKLVTDNGGVVRLPQRNAEDDLSSSKELLEDAKETLDQEESTSIKVTPVASRAPAAEDSTEVPQEVEIITASVILNQARVIEESSGGREHFLIETGVGQQFSLKTTPGTKVQNNQVVAELIDSRYRTSTGGIVKYAGVEVAKRGKAKQGYEVTKGGTLLWIPEECHEINKDISLLYVEEGQYVEPSTEVVKDIVCQTGGVVEVTQKNEILRELVIKPGTLELNPGNDPEEIMSKDGQLARPGEEILPGLSVDGLRYIEYVETPDGPGLLLRPVQEFHVPDSPAVPYQESIDEKGASIKLRAVQRIPYKDGERVKSVEGLELLRTQLILEIDKDAPQLAADIELVEDEEELGVMRLQLVILESLAVRRSDAEATSGKMRTRLLVSDGDHIEPGAVVARTETLLNCAGEVFWRQEGDSAVRRILVVRDEDKIKINCAEAPSVARGDLLVPGSEITPGVPTEASGQVVDIASTATGFEITLRSARPYRVSAGAILHVDEGSLVQRGDGLVLLVFERAKTGDIIQGLPRIEELLEARNPKEACVLAKRPGTAQVIYSDDESVEIKVVEADGTITDYPCSVGQGAIVSDGQIVEAAEPLTDGPANPHEILQIYFDTNKDTIGPYEAALASFGKVQNLLVNEVQSVYQSQGIDISDKHIEVIVRQMTSKVRIDDGGDTQLLPGELVDLRQVEQVNEAMSIAGNAPAEYTPLMLGITKASLNTDSFISAASFQETTRVLTEAAMEGKSDWLRGLKENVIIGRLIPAGTGFNAYERGDQAFDSDPYSATEPEGDMGFDSTAGMDVVDDRTARDYEARRGSSEPDSSSEVGSKNNSEGTPGSGETETSEYEEEYENEYDLEELGATVHVETEDDDDDDDDIDVVVVENVDDDDDDIDDEEVIEDLDG